MKRSSLCRFIGVFLCCAIIFTLIPAAHASSAATAVASEGGFASVSIKPGKVCQLVLSQSDSKAQWVSSAPLIASVDSTGKVTAKAVGSAVVYAVSSKDAGLFESWIITVEETAPISSLQINLRAAGMKVGQTVQLSVSGAEKVIWSSSDATVASVNGSGAVSAKAKGSAVIYAKTEDGRYAASCAVMVIDPTLKMKVASKTLLKGMTLYNSAGTSSVIWTTSNPNVATVKRGFIEAVGTGTAIITAYRLDGTGTQCTVTVTNETAVKSAYLDPFNVTVGDQTNTVVITSPACTSVNVSVLNLAGESVASFAASSGYADKTSGGRKVRIWKVPVVFAASGTIALQASASAEGCAANSYTFYGSVSPAEGTDGIQPRGEASDKLLRFMATYEGLCSTVQYDVVNYPTIGNGIVLNTGDTFYNNQTAEEAYGYMSAYVHRLFSVQLNAFVKKNSLILTQNQYDAMISFAYNMGAYCWSAVHFTLRELLEKTPDASAIDAMQLKYAFGQLSTTGGYFYTGLWRRRIDEWEMFTKGDYDVHPVVTNATTDDFALPTAEERADPEKYKPYWQY